MGELSDRTFKTCMIYKSKQYFKEELKVLFMIGGCVVVSLIVLALIYFGSLLFGSSIGRIIGLLILFDITAFGLITVMVVDLSVSKSYYNYIRTFVILHAIAIVLFFAIVLEIICIFGIPISGSILTVVITYLITNTDWYSFIPLINGLFVGCLLLPVTIAAFKCFNIHSMFTNIIKEVCKCLKYE